MKRTSLYDKHISLNAKMVPFAGYSMPMSYTGIIDEHNAVRNMIGVFDVSHMGEFKISGKGAESFLQLLTINDVKKISTGQAQYSALCLSNGGIVDDIVLYHFEEYYMMVVNAANIKDDYNWLLENSNEDVVIENISENLNLIAVQGPKSAVILNDVLDCNLNQLKYYNFIQLIFNGDSLIVSRTGYTGELGFEIYGNSESIVSLWDNIFDYKKLKVMPVGLGARDTLRLEMNYSLYGMDISRSINPIEAGLGWITSFNKGDFIGRDALLLEKNENHKRRISFEMLERAVPRNNYDIIIDGNIVGKVTSGTQSPTLDKGIGIGYIQVDHSAPGTEISIDIRSREKLAVIVPPPFYKYGTVNNSI
ncbi:MAG: glycine cleavage system protein T [Candidatus Marinimicrobia bacterium]|nr:glycine cleavage system protein T [Candidatus Neomarinimicrobiota bacterium]